MTNIRVVKSKTACLALVLAACGVDQETPNTNETASPVIWGSDDRVPLGDAAFSATAAARAIGRLEGTGTCTATHIGGNLLVTARHCFSDTVDPASLVFRPAFTGPGTAANIAARPSIRGRRYIRGTGDDGKFNQYDGYGFGTYHPGNDWALIEVDPATYSRGTGGPGVPIFPASWSGWPAIRLGSLPNPIRSPMLVTAIGYSADFYAAMNAPGMHVGCEVRRDGVCNAANASEGDGIVLTSCESNGGASGGPVVQGWGTDPQIVGIMAGNGFTAPTYNDDIANKLVNVNGINTVPRRAGGITFTPMGNGVTLAVASDTSSLGQVRWNNFDSVDGIHPRHAWRPWGDVASTGLTFGRMTSTFTPDRHAWIFSLTNAGILNRVETVPGSWSAWELWFPGSAMSIGAIDVEAASTSSVPVQVYSLHSDGSLRTRRKVGTSYLAAWGNEQSLGQVAAGRALAVGTVEGYQQLFVIRPNDVLTSWETQPGSNQWTTWYPFYTGLPNGLDMLDITSRNDQYGRMQVYLLARAPSGEATIYSRTKTSAVAGSPWGEWQRYLSVPRGSTQIEVSPLNDQQIEDFTERLAIVRDGELLMVRQGYYNGQKPDPDFVVPAYSAEPTDKGTCPL